LYQIPIDGGEEVTVRPDGHISTTIVHDELAYGRTVPELTDALQRDYRYELSSPRLSVVLKSFAPTRIYVGGEVTNPGEAAAPLRVAMPIMKNSFAGGSLLAGSHDPHIGIVMPPSAGPPSAMDVAAAPTKGRARRRLLALSSK
jgi:hypothetical protein